MVENNKEAIVLLALETGERASPLERQKSQDFEEVREEGPARLRVLAGRFWSSPPGLKSKVQKVTLAFPATASVGNTRRTLSERWHICSCGVKCQRDLYSAYLACFVEQIGENNSELDAGVAARQWPGAEPLLQAASGRIPNLQVSGCAGQPRKGTEGVAAEEGIAKARDGVVPSPGGGESPGEVAVVPLRIPALAVGRLSPPARIVA